MGIWSKYKKGRRIVGVALLLSSAFAFTSTNQYATLKLAFNFWDPLTIADFRVKQLTTDDLIVRIEQELKDNDIAEAQNLVSLAEQYNHKIPEELKKRTKESYLGQGFRYSVGFANGFGTGDVSSIPSLIGSVTSDLLIYGDLRDITNEGTKLVKGEDYSKIILGLSAFGLTTSIATLALSAVSLTGVAAPVTAPVALAASQLDTGASLIKASYRTHKLSKPLMKRINKATADIVDVKKLKIALKNPSPVFKAPSANAMRKIVSEANFKRIAKGDLTDVKKIFYAANPIDLAATQKQFNGIVNPKATKRLQELASETGSLVETGGMFTAMRALNYADNARDISRISKLTKKFGNSTATVLKLFGKAAYKLGKLLYWLITLVLAVLGWALSALWYCFIILRSALRFVFKLAFWIRKKLIAHA